MKNANELNDFKQLLETAATGNAGAIKALEKFYDSYDNNSVHRVFPRDYENPDPILAACRIEADKGNRAAQYFYGKCINESSFSMPTEDYHKGLEWLKKATDQEFGLVEYYLSQKSRSSS